MPRIRVKNGPNKGTIYPVGDQTVTLGRDATSSIQVLDKGASRQHSEIYRVGEMCFIRDLESRNKTYVNGEEIHEELLRPGDRIQIGSTVFSFEEDGENTPDTDEIDLNEKKEGEGGEAEESLNRHTLQLRIEDLRWVETGEKAPSVAKRSDAFQALYVAARAAADEREEPKLIARMLDIIHERIPADHIYLYLREGESAKLVPKGRLERDPSREVKISRTIIQKALKERRSILTTDAMADARFKAQDSIITNRIRSVLCVPLEIRTKTLGVLYLQSGDGQNPFGQDDLELLTALALILGLQLEALQAESRRCVQFVNVLRGLVTLMEERTPALRGHAGRVCAYGSAMCAELSLSAADLVTVEMTSLLHDVALHALPEGHEATQAKVHGTTAVVECAVSGAKIARMIEGAEAAAESIRAVYERFDGSGGPDKLAGDDIPLPARVVAVAERFDCLTSEADGTAAQPAEDAIRKLKQETDAGAYDKSVTDALIRAYRAGTLLTPQV